MSNAMTLPRENLTMKYRTAAMAIASAMRRVSSARSSGLRFATSPAALSVSRSSRSSALTPSPLRPDTSTNGLLGCPSLVRSRARAPSRATARPSRTRSASTRRPAREADRRKRLLQQLLQIRLPRVDDVVDGRGAPERRRAARAAAGIDVVAHSGRHRGALEDAVVEVPAEQAELPELIRDVLADVGDRAVGSHDHFLARLRVGSRRQRRLGRLAAPAACRPSSIRMTQQPLRRPSVCRNTAPRPLEELEGVRPEVQAQDVAFPREQVVVDVHPRHRRRDGSGRCDRR